MKKIIPFSEFQGNNNDSNAETKIVLVGGCFDILHRGHIAFLEAAGKLGDALWVLLESDETITTYKGANRPVHTQDTRASILASLPSVTTVLLLSGNMTDQDYDEVVLSIKPAIIATTKGDRGRRHKERQAALVNAQVIDVIDRIPNLASSSLAEQITDL